MKRILSIVMLAAFLTSTITACGQDTKEVPSPPAKATGKAGNTSITIDYSAPSAKGRKIYGELVPYGKVWRTGANNATVFEIDGDVKIEGQALPKGKYGFFAIPNETEWTLIFNKTWNQWGAFRYKQEEDVLRVKVKPAKTAGMVEKLVYTVNNGVVTLAWENTEVSFKVN